MKPYNSEEPKKKQVEQMFDNIAPVYDKMNHLLSLNIDRGWRKKVVEMASKAHPIKILDVATGTGDLAIALARRILEAHITGGDISEEMLRIGEKKVLEAGLGERITLEKADAEHLRFDDGEFDTLTAAFGVRNFQDIPAGLREMARVLRQGGEIYVLEFSIPRGKIFGGLYRFYFHRILPTVGGWFSKDKNAYRYLPESVDEFPEKSLFLQMLRDAGFTACRAKSQTLGVAQIYYGKKS